MFLPARDSKAAELGRPVGVDVESIMRCEDFKSNFARRLSNRYIARYPAGQKLKADEPKPAEKSEETLDIVRAPEIELCSQLSKSITMEQDSEVVKTSDKNAAKNEQIKATEVTALNREVELLKWQLAQTEANRQMQIALLKQIVSFLNRVKEHMESQGKQHESRKASPARLHTSSFTTADFPRSKSVLNVNKLLEYPGTKNTRKISKSISNENGFADYNIFLNQSKLSLNQETDSKLTEEISRLITLAKSVLSTKLPDLTCTCDKTKTESDNFKQDSQPELNTEVTIETQSKSNFNGGLDLIEEAFTLCYIDTNNLNKTITNSSGGIEDSIAQQQTSSPIARKKTDLSNGTTCKREINFNAGANFIEDESGFSSMNSFQEIGIPVINIIPPTPCKSAAATGFPASDYDIFDETNDLLSLSMHEMGKWDAETIEIDKQAMKVFWV